MPGSIHLRWHVVIVLLAAAVSWPGAVSARGSSTQVHDDERTKREAFERAYAEAMATRDAGPCLRLADYSEPCLLLLADGLQSAEPCHHITARSDGLLVGLDALDQRNTCFLIVGIKHDPAACGNISIEESGSSQERDLCYFVAAHERKDPRLCTHIEERDSAFSVSVCLLVVSKVFAEANEPFELGRVWRVRETAGALSATGTWTRRGDSAVFDGEWTVTVTGERKSSTVTFLRVYRSQDGSRWVELERSGHGKYTGKLTNGDRSVVNGTADHFQPGWYWMADIEGR